MRSYLCLVNPLAGGQAGERLIKTLNALQAEQGRKIEAHAIDFGNLERQLEQASKFDALLIAGGDGTFSSVLAKVSDPALKVGILPLGTGNDLARTLSVRRLFSVREPQRLINYYDNAQSRSVQMWKLRYGENLQNTRSFINYLSFGYDAAVVTRFAQFRKNRFNFLHRFGSWGNRFGYLLCGTQGLLKRAEVNATIVGSAESIKHAWSIFFANIPEVMGLGYSNRLSSPFDSTLECRIIQSFTDYLSFTGIPVGAKGVKSKDQWEINFASTPVAQADGEEIANVTGTRFIIEAGARVNLLG